MLCPEKVSAEFPRGTIAGRVEVGFAGAKAEDKKLGRRPESFDKKAAVRACLGQVFELIKDGEDMRRRRERCSAR